MRTLKKLLALLALMLATVSAGRYLEALHVRMYTEAFNRCVEDLSYKDEYKEIDQALRCAARSSWQLQVLGTVLWAEGSYLDE